MKSASVIMLIFFSVILLFCLIATEIQRRKHPGRTSSGLRLVFLFMTFPLMGNFIALITEDELISTSGYIVLLLGIGLLCFNMVGFVMDYCEFKYRNTPVQYISLALFAVYSVSICLNPVFHHVFYVKESYFSDGRKYYDLISLWGRYIGFAIIELLLLIMIIALVVKCTRISSAYFEKYIFLIISLIVCALFEAYFMFSDIAVDMIIAGYIIYGVMSFYLLFLYRPLFIRGRLTNAVVENHNDGIIFYDANADALYANDQAFNILEVEEHDPDKCTDRLIEIMGGADIHANFEIPAKFVDAYGNTRYLIINHRLMKDSRKLDIGSFFSIHDNTSEVRLDERRRYLSRHDELTGLYNRSTFIEEVDDLRKKNPETAYYMIVSDINDFKLVNDVFGRESADRTLINIANIIMQKAHKGSVYCRWGGDVFAAFARKDVINFDDLEKMVAAAPVKDASINHPVIVHIGIYEMTPGEDIETAVMVDRATLAISSIKNDLSRRLAVYDNKLRADKIWEQRITSELPNAIAEGQIVPFIQPQYNFKGELEGGEILVRWDHKTEGLLSPARFIPIFEKNGLIAKIDHCMWESACSILSRWAKEGGGREKLNLSINISPKDFYFMNIYEVITSLVEKHNVDPARLRLEITESAIMSNPAENMKTITSLREYGFTIEMDDFGSGYSSLNMLKDMPVDVLKLDMVFLGKTADYAKSKIILSSIVNMANNLNMPPITEGVETKEQRDMMLEMGCKLFQGYYFSKPVPVSEFEKLPLVWKE